jgi:hypothetical protein
MYKFTIPERVYDMEHSLMAAVAGGSIVLAGRIVWDWLSGNNRKPCIFHEGFYNMVMENNQKLNKISEDVAFIKGRMEHQ